MKFIYWYLKWLWHGNLNHLKYIFFLKIIAQNISRSNKSLKSDLTETRINLLLLILGDKLFITFKLKYLNFLFHNSTMFSLFCQKQFIKWFFYLYFYLLILIISSLRKFQFLSIKFYLFPEEWLFFILFKSNYHISPSMFKKMSVVNIIS